MSLLYVLRYWSCLHSNLFGASRKGNASLLILDSSKLTTELSQFQERGACFIPQFSRRIHNLSARGVQWQHSFLLKAEHDCSSRDQLS